MRGLQARMVVASAVLSGTMAPCFAQLGGINVTSSGMEATRDLGGGAQFFVGQRLWLASWEQHLLDTQIGVASPTNPTLVAREEIVSVVSNSKIAPLTALGVRYRDFNVTATVLPRTSFSSEGKASGDSVGRREADFSIGYSILPNLIGSLVYKTGKVDKLTTANTTALTGETASAKLDGLLFGLSGSAPLQGPFALYGNFAIGPARSTTSSSTQGDIKLNGSYRIGEVGLLYRLTDERAIFGIKNLSVQLGYRVQVLTFRDATLNTYALGSPVPTVLATEHRRLQNTTQGFVLGIVAVF